MDKLTDEEFNTLARTGEITLTTERNESEIAKYLFRERGWADKDIHYQKDTDEGWLRIWVNF